VGRAIQAPRFGFAEKVSTKSVPNPSCPDQLIQNHGFCVCTPFLLVDSIPLQAGLSMSRRVFNAGSCLVNRYGEYTEV